MHIARSSDEITVFILWFKVVLLVDSILIALAFIAIVEAMGQVRDGLRVDADGSAFLGSTAYQAILDVLPWIRQCK